MRKQSIFILLITLFTSTVFAQVDSLIFKNGDYIIGEAKTMDRGVLTFETDYSDNDFKIEWDGIKEIYTATYFLITLSDGSRYNGHINSSDNGTITISTDEGKQIEAKQSDIVMLNDVDQGFWSQLYFSFDVGLDLTKANNFKQVSARSNIGYIDKRWKLNATYNTLFARQDEIEDIKRTDGGIGYNYLLPKDWYPLVSLDFLSNTEQNIQLRTTGKLGMGKYIIHTNYTYWGFSLGANYNDENFSIDSIPDRKSWEGFIGTELNLFNIGDLSLLTKIFAYPGITEPGRWRSDFNFDAKYEMPFDNDFYIKLGVTLNYDNQPAEPGKETDYVFHTGFGWSL
ncbi:MAG: DUF481 domain-containing protein [Chlorobi bacterium]|nr:DUF481 domain-containing protein [Chlorobiota bacterium]